MENFVSVGNVNGKHFVISTEDFVQSRIGPFKTAEEARSVAAQECDRLREGKNAEATIRAAA